MSSAILLESRFTLFIFQWILIFFW